MPDQSSLVLVAQVGGAHGVRGEIRITAYTQDPMALLDYGPLLDQHGQAKLHLIQARPTKTGLVARCEGVNSREQAETLHGAKLFVRRDSLPEPDEDEFYLADLIGLSAVDPLGVLIGKVREVTNFGAGDLLEIAPVEGGPTWYLSFTRETVPQVDVAAGKLVVVRPLEIGGPEDPEV